MKFAAKEDKLLFMSCGTGFTNTSVKYDNVSSFNAIQWAPYLIRRIMEDSSLQQITLMELVGRSPNVKGPTEWTAFSRSNVGKCFSSHVSLCLP